MIDVHDELAVALAGHYEIEREIGRGGMATVYLARDVRHDRHVAVKVLRADSPSSLGTERFLREISISARLTHPNILALYDSGAVGSTLYFVMPYVEGQTLRQRLDREHQLPLDEAIAITHQIAAALDYAHERGVVHRDIKPENVLLLGENVLVADFGLARAMYSATSPRLTGSATVVGTPAYMSPEQAAGDSDVDGRSDLYSLACVLFEMVTGSPPFQGATVQVLMMHHLSTPPPSICAQRKSCPPWVDDAVRRALEKMPADRFRTAMQFARALEQQSPGGATITASSLHGPRTSFAASVLRRKRPVIWAATGLLAIAGALVWRTTSSAVATPVLNDTLYFIAPFQHRGGATSETAAAVTERVNDALTEWRGVLPVVGGVGSLNGADGNAGGNDRLKVARAAALGSGARWLVWGDVADDGDSLTVRASLYDAGRSERVGFRLMRHARAGIAPRVRYRELVNGLLRSREELPWNLEGDQWRPSLPAWAAYDRGREAITRWDLEGATAAFRQAVEMDAEFARAHLWLSLVDNWSLRPVEQWTNSARHAYALRERLDSGDAALAEAQLHAGEGRYPEGCAAYGRAIRHDSTDFRGWLGLGDCQARDSVVVSALHSRSRYRFRSSYQAAARAYFRARAYMLRPHPAFLYQRLSKVLLTEANIYRPGRRAGASSIGYAAFPELQGDTIAFVPYPFSMIIGAHADASPPSQVDALERNRQLLRTVYLQWTSDAPTSVDAHVALAMLLETTEELEPGGGRPSALSEIVTARSLLPKGLPRRELTLAQVRFLVKAGRWNDAKSLVDSLFRTSNLTDPDEAKLLAGAAALTGRLEQTARMLRLSPGSLRLFLPGGIVTDLPVAIQREVIGFLPHAALGSCGSEVEEFPPRLESQLASYYPDPVRARAVRDVLLRRLLMLAAPCGRPLALKDVDASGDPWVRMYHALHRADINGVRNEFEELKRARRGIRPGEAAVDGTYVEAWMLAAAGDTATAVEHLDHTLGALSTLGSQLLEDPVQSAGLVRAMALRASLAARLGDHATARRWGTAVAVLWRDADPPLRPFVQHVRRVAG